jgi:tetratricopeptide (TPR) repeat protein
VGEYELGFDCALRLELTWPPAPAVIRADVLESTARALIGLNDWDGAEAASCDAVREFPQGASGWLAIAYCALNRGDHEEATLCAEEAVRLGEQNSSDSSQATVVQSSDSCELDSEHAHALLRRAAKIIRAAEALRAGAPVTVRPRRQARAAAA